MTMALMEKHVKYRGKRGNGRGADDRAKKTKEKQKEVTNNLLVTASALRHVSVVSWRHRAGSLG